MTWTRIRPGWYVCRAIGAEIHYDGARWRLAIDTLATISTYDTLGQAKEAAQHLASTGSND